MTNQATEAPITDQEWERLVSFKGYGRIDAPAWFIGMEEGGTGTIADLRERAQKHDEVEDLLQAHLKIGGDIKKSRTQTWRIMSHMMLYATGDPNWIDSRLAADYRNERLGRNDGDTLLTDLMPISCRNRAQWVHTTRFETKDEYEASVLPQRVEMLRNMLLVGQPRFVICYGVGFWHRYEGLFSHAEFKDMDGIRGKLGSEGNTRVMLAPFLDFTMIPKARISDACEMLGLRFGLLR